MKKTDEALDIQLQKEIKSLDKNCIKDVDYSYFGKF